MILKPVTSCSSLVSLVLDDKFLLSICAPLNGKFIAPVDERNSISLLLRIAYFSAAVLPSTNCFVLNNSSILFPIVIL